ncbi:hypothetical protein EV189_2762 [Motilibacter rhizosphaerae]|uniref:SnoaL-like protein n=1 Tax=Motilibacter rhizosphaerae TaxID=598652 RepID=A0A4V2F4E6_9ACTN|nr:hypothetical protein [Motilibacter rhizosphaerae]RZS87337.1 hypothetical protein EV189_2762 [Motilibacter rhizosphaerae]
MNRTRTRTLAASAAVLATAVGLAAPASAAPAKKDGRDPQTVALVASIASTYGVYDKDLDRAYADGFQQAGECEADPAGSGAKGIAFVDWQQVVDGFDPAHPAVLRYRTDDHGRYRLVGAEFLVFDADQDASTVEPLRFGSVPLNGPLRLDGDGPLVYELPVWAWKHEVAGTFADWNAQVSCPDLH